MGRTQIGGNRIAPKSIKTQHLADDFVIPEKQLVLNNPTHPHSNKEALDIIINSNPATIKSIDIKDIVLMINEVVDARDAGKTLKNTIAAKINFDYIEPYLNEIDLARGSYADLDEALRVVVTKAQDAVNSHKGIIAHSDLDIMYNEVKDARGIYSTLKERFESIGAGGGTGGTGTVDVTMLTPWDYVITLTAGQRDIDLPNSYVLGLNSLQVFEGPILLYAGTDNDYVEVSPTQIKLNYDVPDGTTLKISGVGAGRLFEWVFYIISVEGQNKITFLDTYRPGMRELEIFEDGMLLSPGIDYTETDNKTVTLIQPFKSQSNIAIFKRRY